MRIKDLRSETIQDRARVVATVIWEDYDQEPQELFYETTQEFADDLSCNPHAFLLGAIMPAIQRGEQRIAIEASICPELRNGLMTAIGWLREWSLLKGSIRIESSAEVRYPKAVQPRAGAFLSGGVDSLAMLRVNRRDFPMDHPSSFRDCLFVHGFDIGGVNGKGAESLTFEMGLQAASRVAQDVNATLIPVFTNVRHLLDDVDFWIYRFHGSALASVAHAFSHRLTSVSIASGFKLSNLAKAGTHPLIDPNYGSASLRIRHGDILLSRLDRVKLVADWPTALENLRVCTMNPPGQLNCGMCEKCLRTMLQFLALGKLDGAHTFPYQDVLPDMLEDIAITKPYQDAWYEELIRPLVAQHRLDLVEVIYRKRQAFQKRLVWEEERDWKGVVKKFDRKCLGSSLYRIYSAIRAPRVGNTVSDP
jgi:hypothetical protein